MMDVLANCVAPSLCNAEIAPLMPSFETMDAQCNAVCSAVIMPVVSMQW